MFKLMEVLDNKSFGVMIRLWLAAEPERLQLFNQLTIAFKD